MSAITRQNLPKTAVRVSLLMALTLALFLTVHSTRAEATNIYTVNSSADTDDGSCDALVPNVSDCTLREAVEATQASPEADTINFDIPAKDDGCPEDNVCTIVLGSLLPTITVVRGTTIDGTGAAITISGDSTTHIFSISSSAPLTLRRLTMTNGKAVIGGAINNGGILEVIDSTFSSNTASDSGGAIYNIGTLTVRSSTFNNNQAADEVGGAIWNNTGGLMTVHNSTFSENSAGAGGAIYADNGSITHSTFYGNIGGAVVDTDSAAPLALANSILASSDSGGNCDTNAGGIIEDGGGNISSDGSCGFTAAGSVNSTNPQLDSDLGDNGGPTQTHALLAVSPAIDAAAFATCLPNDQRGEQRPRGNGCDSGSYEADQPFVVNATEDTDDGFCEVLLPGVSECTLREALTIADSQSGDNSIHFDIPAADGGCSADNVCTITLAAALPDASDPTGTTIIDGTGADIAVDGNDAVRPFNVATGAALTLRNMTIRDGNALLDGGGILNNGTLAIEECTFSDNTSAFGRGGAIYNDNIVTVENSIFRENDGRGGGAIDNAGSLMVTKSAFFDNISLVSGGAIDNTDSLTVTDSVFSNNSAAIVGGAIAGTSVMVVENSTFSGNSADSWGGAVYAHDGSITNSTFYGNSADLGGSVVVRPAGTLTMTNNILATSLLADNTPGSNCRTGIGSVLSDGGGNISDDATCGFSGDDIDPELDTTLADNGGPTLTHALLDGSPAIDNALLTECPDADQRGVARPQGTGCDSGAFEYGQAPAFFKSFYLPLILGSKPLSVPE